MQKHSGLISTASQIQAIVAELRKKDVIAFDTEFIREATFYPVVEVIQVATDQDAWLIDAQAFLKNQASGKGLLAARGKRGLERKAGEATPQGDSALVGIQPLREVFQDSKILKVIHAAQGDQECLFTGFGIVASPSLDTALAASLCGYGDGVGLANLVKSVLKVNLKKGHARTNWSVRPLPPQLQEYALADVEHLVQLGRVLLNELDDLGRREWALELSAHWEDFTLYDQDPDAIADRMARGGKLDKPGFAALMELVRWRENRVKQMNLPRRWIADDNVLMDLARVRPADLQHLEAFRGLNRGELKNSGAAILEALQRASQRQDLSPPKGTRPTVPTESETQVFDLLKCYMGILADGHKVAVRHLIHSSQYLPLMRSHARTPEELVQQELLNPHAVELVGKEIIAMLNGRRALSVAPLPSGKSYEVKVVDIE